MLMDGRTDGKPDPYITPCLRKVRQKEEQGGGAYTFCRNSQSGCDIYGKFIHMDREFHTKLLHVKLTDICPSPLHICKAYGQL